MKQDTTELELGLGIRRCCHSHVVSRFGLSSRRSVFLIVCVWVLVICFSGCGRSTVTSTNNALELSLDLNAARMLSNSLVDDLLNDRRPNIRASLENAFRDTIDEKQFNVMLDKMVEAYGKPLAFEFKRYGSGTKEYPENQRKPVLKFWYAAETTKYHIGSHFLVVEVVPDGPKLAVSSFAIVNFPEEVPQELK